MRNFISKMLYFIVPVLIIGIAMEIALRNIPNNYTLKQEYLNKNSNKIKTLILGSSHAFAGLDPGLFSKKSAFNAAQLGQLLSYDDKILNKYKNNLKNLKTIIIPVSYGLLWVSYKNKRFSNLRAEYINYYGFGKFYEILNFSETSKLKFFDNLERIFSYYRYGNTNITCSKLGWAFKYKENNNKNLIKSANETLKQQTIDDLDLKKYRRNFHQNILILKSILQWSYDNNVNVILFTPPATKTFYNNLNEKQFSITLKNTLNLTKEFNNSTYLNLISDTRFDNNDFWDATHLSEFGAEKLSKIIDSVQLNFKNQTNYSPTK